MRSRSPATAPGLGKVALLALLASFTVPGFDLPRAVAQHADEEAAAGGPQVADELIAFHSDDEIFSVELPRNWNSEKYEKGRGALGFWTGPAVKRSNAAFEASLVRDAWRPALAHWSHSVQAEGFVADSVETGDGWIQSKNIAPNQRRVFWRRYVEFDGVVLMATVIAAHVAADDADELARKILATFTPKTAPDRAVRKADWTEKSVKGFTLVTDAEKDRMDEAVTGVEDVIAPAREIIRKALSGKPYIESDPVVRVYTLPVHFRSEAELLGLGTPDDTFVDPRDLAQVVTLTSFGLDNAHFGIGFMTAIAYQEQYFGGVAPHWLRAGLARYTAYAIRDGGKPDKPDKDRVKKMKGRISGANASLDSHFAKGPNDYTDVDETDVLWAWHWFLRHGKSSKKFRKPYEDYIEVLRETGDPKKADEVWADVDFGKMLEAFRKWGESL